MSSSIRTLIFLPLCLLAFACGSDPTSQAENVASQGAMEKTTAVHIQIVKPQDLEERFSLPGSLVAWQDLLLAAETAGTIDWVGPDEGELLAAGQNILTIDSVSQKANLERDRVDAEIKQKNMQRMERLVAENLVSRQEFDNSVTAFEAAKQKLELSRIALQKSIVQAPVAGVLDARMVDRGEYVKVGDPVATVVQVDRLKVLMDVPEKDVRYLHVGEEVNVIQAQIDTGEKVRRNGKLFHLAYKADPMTRTYLGKVEVDNSDRLLRPGMIVRIEALRRVIKDAIAIPLYAVVDVDGRKVVFVEKSGKAELRVVNVERVVGSLAVIDEGLSVDEHLVVKGQQLLADGTNVKVEAD